MVYVCGFLFSPNLRWVALIRKKRGPAGMAGKLNGIGGKVEPCDNMSARSAMVREFREETGLETHVYDWMCFHTERFVETNNTVHFMCGVRADVNDVRTITDEVVELIHLGDSPDRLLNRPMYNLPYLVPMAKTWLMYPQHRYVES